MKTIEQHDPILLTIAILNHNDGSMLVKEAIKLGLSGGFITPAKGLISSAILNMLSIRHNRRDIVMMTERRSVMMPALEILTKRFKMDKPNHGILFTIEAPLSLNARCALEDNNWNLTQADYQLLLITFRHGLAKDVIGKLNQISTAGATIFTGKGEYLLERQQMLGLPFAPQKDVILTVVENEVVPRIFTEMETHFNCSQSKGMSIIGMDTYAFSQAMSIPNVATPNQQALLISIISEETALEEEYLRILKHYKMNGGSSLKGRGSMSPEVMQRIFNITINPQKKILLTIDSTEKVTQVYQEITASSILNEKHKGIYLIVPVEFSYGLYRKEK